MQVVSKAQIERRGKLLILTSGGLNAAFSVIVLMVAARTISIEDTGILTIAVAISKLLLNIGKYGMRNYQVTEQKMIAFSEWLASRIITTGIMMLCAVIYMVYQRMFQGYSLYKTSIVLLLCAIYAVECLEDIYTGYYQQQNRLDVASYIQTVRYVALYLIFAVGLFVTQNLLLTCVVAFLFSILIFYFTSVRTLRYFPVKHESPNKTIVLKLLTDCFPLCLMSFILIYLSNAPKYEIDGIYDAETQAYFGFVSMPIFAISLLSGFIFQPQIVNLSSTWKNRQITAFQKIVHKQFLYIIAMSAFCVIAGWGIGIPVLSALYGVQGLDAYRAVFVVLLIGGAATAVINFLSALLTIFRCQKIILYTHMITGVGVFLTIKIAIAYFGIMGASLATTLWTWGLAAMLAIVYVVNVRHVKNYGEL